MQSEGQNVERFGGVLANARSQLLLQRSETDFFDDLPWTFVNGPSKKDETPDQAALRIVYEETGYRARIISALGNYDGSAPATGLLLDGAVWTSSNVEKTRKADSLAEL